MKPEIPNLTADAPNTTRSARWWWTIDLDATAGPVPDLAGGTSGGKACRMRATSVTVSTRVTDGDTPHTSVLVAGKRVKKDDTCDFVGATTVFRRREDMPDWLWSLVWEEFSAQLSVTFRVHQ